MAAHMTSDTSTRGRKKTASRKGAVRLTWTRKTDSNRPLSRKLHLLHSILHSEKHHTQIKRPYDTYSHPILLLNP